MKSQLKTAKKTSIIGYMDKDSHVITLLKTSYKETGKSYAVIHSETGIDRSVICQILNGKQYASLAMLCKIGKALDLQPERIAKSWKKDKIADIDAEIDQILKTT